MQNQNSVDGASVQSIVFPLRTERFYIHRIEVSRDEAVGFPRTMFHAWFHSQDVPKPVCVITINEGWSNYVEWVHVDELWRRRGIATEVMRAIEQDIGGLTYEGVSDAGEAFCEAYEAKYPSPA